MSLVTNVAPLLWLLASGGAFFFVFRPSKRWAVVGTPARALLVFVAVFLGGAALMTVTRRGDEPKPPSKVVQSKPRVALPDPALVRAHPERYLTLDRVKADRNQAGDVLLSGGAINTSGLPIGEPRLTCRMSNGAVGAGTVTTVVHETIPAGGRLIFAAINLGQADGAWDHWACAVVEAKAG